MCTYKQACDNAQKMFAKNGYLNRVIGACDLPDKWLFFSRFSENGVIEFGNRPISVEKETGILSWFNPFSGEGIKEYDAAVPIPLPGAIEDTSIRSVRRYTDINGNNVANKNDNGRIVGRSKDKYQAITHFKNKDVEVY